MVVGEVQVGHFERCDPFADDGIEGLVLGPVAPDGIGMVHQHDPDTGLPAVAQQLLELLQLVLPNRQRPSHDIMHRPLHRIGREGVSCGHIGAVQVPGGCVPGGQAQGQHVDATGVPERKAHAQRGAVRGNVLREVRGALQTIDLEGRLVHVQHEQPGVARGQVGLRDHARVHERLRAGPQVEGAVSRGGEHPRIIAPIGMR